MATLGDIVINLRANSSQFVGGVGAARGSLGKLNTSSKGTHGNLGRLATQTGLVDARLSLLASTAGLTAAAVVGVGVASVAALRDYGQFTGNLQRSFAIQDLTIDQQQRMSEAARATAHDVSASANQMAEAYFFLASAGFDAEQQIAALPAVAAFAQAGNFDLALATDLLTDSQSALGLASDDAAQNLLNLQRVSDVLLGGNTLFNASSQQLAESLTAGVGAQARTLGIQVEELVAVLGVYADQGIKSSDASTLLSIALRDLETKAILNREAFTSAGIAVHDSEGEFRLVEEVVGDLEASLAGLSDEARKTKLMELGFSDKSVKSLLLLLGTSDQIRDYRQELEQVGGKTQDVADNSLTRLDRATNATAKAWSDLKFEVGGAAEVFATPAVYAFAGALDALAFSASGYSDLFRGIGSAAEYLGDIFLARVEPNVQRAKRALEEFFAIDPDQFQRNAAALGGVEFVDLDTLKPDALDFSGMQQQLATIAGSREGIEQLANYFAAGAQSSTDIVDAFRSVNPALDEAVGKAALFDFANGIISAEKLREIVTGLTDEAARFDFAVDLTAVEQIGGTFEQQQQALVEFTRRQGELNRSVREGSMSAEEFGRATRAVEAARDEATGGSAALVVQLQNELELVGLNITERERLAAILQNGARIEDANRVAGLRTELAVAGELLMLKTKLAEAKYGKETVEAGTRLGVGIDQIGQFAAGDFAGLGLDPAALQQMAALQEQINAQNAANELASQKPERPKAEPEDRRDRSAATVRSGDAFSRVLAAMRAPNNNPQVKAIEKSNTKLGQLVTKTDDLLRAVEEGAGELIA